MFLLHTEISTVMNHKLINFIERTFIEQHINTFAGSHMTIGMLLFNTLYSSTLSSQFIQLLKFFILFCCCHKFNPPL